MTKKELLEKGVKVIATFKEFRSFWDGNKHGYNCFNCGKEDVKTMEWVPDEDICYRCFISYWNKGGTYVYDPDKISEYEASELFDKWDGGK